MIKHPNVADPRATLHAALSLSLRASLPAPPTRELVDAFKAHDLALQELAAQAVWLYRRLDETLAELTNLYTFLDAAEADGEGDNEA